MKPFVVFRPIKTNIQTQKFGENKACARVINGQVAIPYQIIGTNNSVCPIGYTSLYQYLGLRGHSGEDWITWHGEPVYFPVLAEGVEWYAKTEKDANGGVGVDIISKQPVNLGNGRFEYVKFRFWHLKEVIVSDGEGVKFGQWIGRCDNTGLSSGDHLHWAMKIVDQFGNTLNRTNGYMGAEDFQPYFENSFVLDIVGLQNQVIQAQFRLIDLLNKFIFHLKQQLK